MGRIIRRTVTVTITESWTIVWTGDSAVDETPQPQATTIVQAYPKTQEEPDALLQTPINRSDAANPGEPSEPTTMLPKAKKGSLRERTRRRAKGNQPNP